MKPILMLFIFVPILSLILLVLNLLLSVNNPDENKLASYECGFIRIDQTRSKFDIQFYIVAILFLIFDLEIILIYPFFLASSLLSYFGFSIFIVFIFILTVGFILEIGSGAIKISTSSSSQF